MKARNYYVTLVERTLSGKRFIHSKNVADMCQSLAEIYGCNKDKAYIAGILHDVRKEAETALQSDEAARCRFSPDPVELVTPKLLHALSGAYFIEEHLGITDEDMLLAVRYHTIGAPNATTLQKIVYMSDLISVERDYSDVEYFRSLTYKNLDDAFYEALRWYLKDKIDRGVKITKHSINAYNDYAGNK